MLGSLGFVGSNVAVVMAMRPLARSMWPVMPMLKTVVNGLPRAEVDAGLINTLDGNDVAQKEYGPLIEVHDRACLLQRLGVRWLISTIRPGERSLAGQCDHLPLILGRSRVAP